MVYMKKTNTTSVVSDLEDQVATEIKKHKWIESEKAGKDIGWDAAYSDWLDKHFPNWKKYQLSSLWN